MPVSPQLLIKMAEVGQSTQLDFHQAMEDFKIMFPDMDSDVIEVYIL